VLRQIQSADWLREGDGDGGGDGLVTAEIRAGMFSSCKDAPFLFFLVF
jgi:hypothetical protein